MIGAVTDTERAQRVASARARAAETKRARSREQLLAAGSDLFRRKGWSGTRMEDIASAANLSVATAYNHFASKQALIATIYAPLLEPLADRARADIEASAPAEEAIRRGVVELARLTHEHQPLTVALIQAISDLTARGGERTNPPRLVPFPNPIVALVEAGQERGALGTRLPGREVATFLVNGLLLRVLTRPQERPEDTAELMLAMLFGALR